MVADVSVEGVKALLAPDRHRLNALIHRKYPYESADVAAQTPQRTGQGERVVPEARTAAVSSSWRPAEPIVGSLAHSGFRTSAAVSMIFHTPR